MLLTINDIIRLSQFGRVIYIDHSGKYITDEIGVDKHRPIRSTMNISMPIDVSVEQIDMDILMNEQTGGSGLNKKTIAMMVSALKVSASVGSDVLTGQDEIVSLISVVADSMIFVPVIKELVNSNNTVIKKLLTIKFKTPDQVKTETVAIMERVPDAEVIILCNILTPILDHIAPLIGDWLDVFMPDTGGVVGTTIQYLISSSGTSQSRFDKLTSLYNKLPSDAKSYLSNPRQLHDMMIEFSDNLMKSLIQEGGDGSGFLSSQYNNLKSSVSKTTGMALNQLKKSSAPTMKGLKILGLDKPLVAQFDKFFKTQFIPNIDRAIEMLQIILPLCFIILSIDCIKKTGK